MAKKALHTKTPQQYIEEIFAIFKITKVINVDDIYESTMAVDDVIAALSRLWPDTRDSIPKIFQDADLNNYLSDIELFNVIARQKWDECTLDEQREIVARLAQTIGTTIGFQERETQKIGDQLVAKRLQAQIPTAVSFSMLTPLQWTRAIDRLLADATPDTKVLCLFDQDLSGSEGFGEDSGAQFLKAVINKETNGNVICGLLTHKIAQADDEYNGWDTLARELETTLDRFLPIAKSRLEGDADSLSFAQAIKKTTLNLYCYRIKQEAIKVISDANEKALTELKDIDVYDFDHMIMQSSYNDGAWEVDTLVRLYQILQRDRIRLNLLSEGGVGMKLNEIILEASPISKVEIPHDLSARPRILRQKELYETLPTIRNSPLQAGDIFRLSFPDSATGAATASLEYILLAQPCDLTVRGDGTRGMKSLQVPLVPIRRLEKKAGSHYKETLDKRGYDFWRTHENMLYYYDDPTDVALLTFKETAFIDVRVLELSIVDLEDRCYLDLSTPYSIPPQLPIGWREHLKKTVEYFIELSDKLTIIKQILDTLPETGTQATLWEAMMPHVSLSNTHLPLPTIPYLNNSFDFRLQRIKRYREAGTTHLLNSYTRFLSRDAEGHDFAFQE